MAQLNFDANQVDPHVGFDPIPAGKYLALVTTSEFKPNKAGNGRYLQLEYQIVDGPHKGRKLWSRHNLEHPNAQTVQIARGELSAICRAVGVMTPQDSAELHNLPLTITVKVKQREDTGEPTHITVRETAGEDFPRILAYQLGPKPALREPGADEDEPTPVGVWDTIDDEPPF